MGRFLNKGNQRFAEFSRTKCFVDKTEILNVLLEKDADEKFICSSRPRRFGKSVTASMMIAYFSKGVDSRSLFEPLKCTKNDLFLKSMNQYDTIFVDIQAQFVIIFDEWDYPVRELDKNSKERLDYIEFLRGLFKNSDAIWGADQPEFRRAARGGDRDAPGKQNPCQCDRLQE